MRPQRSIPTHGVRAGIHRKRFSGNLRKVFPNEKIQNMLWSERVERTN